MTQALTDATIRAARKRRDTRLNEVANALKGGNRNRLLQRLVRRYLQDHLVHLAFAADEFVFGSEKTPSRARLLECAAQINPFKELLEPTVTRFRPKRGGGARRVVEFGRIGAARQRLVLSLLHVVKRLSPRQFHYSGGAPRAVSQLVNDIAERRLSFVVVADVADHFGSINPSFLHRAANLPRRVIENVVADRSDELSQGLGNNFPPPKGRDRPRTAAMRKGEAHSEVSDGVSEYIYECRGRIGVPQGSPLSPIVGEMALEPCVSGLVGRVPAVNYQDNFAFGCRTMAEAVQHAAALKTALQLTEAGPFALKYSIHDVHSGFEFLGYEIAFDPAWNPSLVPTYDSEARFGLRIEKGLRQRESLDKLVARAASWSASYGLSLEQACISGILNAAMRKFERDGQVYRRDTSSATGARR